MFNWFKKLFKKKTEKKRRRRVIKRKYYSAFKELDNDITHCELKGCINPLNMFSSKCPYCQKWHCSEHILPENHNCINPQLPDYLRNHGSVVKYGR